MRLFIRALLPLSLPVVATILAPLFIIIEFNNHLLAFDSFFSGFILIAGILLIILGLGFLIATINLFLKVGKGILAPWNSPKKLVINGVYRYVRNPMISGVLMILLDEALIFASFGLFIFFVMFFVVNHVYFVYSEEPGLIKGLEMIISSIGEMFQDGFLV